MSMILSIIYSIMVSFANTVSSITTQKFKIDPAVLSVYRGLGVALLILPFLIFIPYPTCSKFYVFAITSGLITSFSFRLVTSIIEEHGANITSKFITIPPVLVAVIWWVSQPTKFVNFVNDDPYKAIGAIFCLLGMIFTIFALGHDKKTHKALIQAIPLFVMYTAQSFLVFFAMKCSELIPGIFYYAFIQSLIIGVVNYFVHVHNLHTHDKDKILLTLFDKKVMKAGAIFVVAVLLSKLFINCAFKYSPHPSYVVLITNMQIIWVYLVSKKLKLKNMISPIKGVILAIYSIVFIMLTY